MSPDNQKRWLSEHVPHRVRACLAGIKFQEELLGSLNFNESTRAIIRGRCFGNAAWEGRLAGTRWLIEFVGIAESKDKPCRPNRREVDVSISHISGGLEIDLSSTEAKVLSKIWKGCSQASGHPTQDSNHPAVDDAALDEAMRIIVAHLEKTIYTSAKLRLIDETLKT